MSAKPRIAYFGVLQSLAAWVVIAYDFDCRPFGEPVAHFPYGTAGMLDALAEAHVLTSELCNYG